MPYALFTNNEQISQAYKTEDEVWEKADEAGLVVDVASQEEEKNPKRVLDEDYCIQPCQADASQPSAQPRQECKQDIDLQAHAHATAGKRIRRRLALAAKS